MVRTHQHSCEEGMTKPLPPQEAEKIWHGPSNPQKVIQLHHWEHPDWLQHRLYGNCLASECMALQTVVTIYIDQLFICTGSMHTYWTLPTHTTLTLQHTHIHTLTHTKHTHTHSHIDTFTLFHTLYIHCCYSVYCISWLLSHVLPLPTCIYYLNYL